MDKEFLLDLLTSDSPSGYEQNCVKTFDEFMSKFSKNILHDAVGNSAYVIGEGGGKKTIMLSAHVDEIAMQVQNIDENGFVHFIKDGYTDLKSLIGTSVRILTENGTVRGVIGKKPIHLEEDEDDTKAIEAKDLKIDIGVSSKDEAAELVSVGDPIVSDTIPYMIGPNRIVSKGLDDKSGLYVVGEVMRLLSTTTLRNVQVVGVACTQEETSASGAVAAARALNPFVSIDYDVTFATDDGYVDANEWGDVKLGGGGCIAHGADCNVKLTRLARKVCKENKIPFQEFSLESGATNTVEIKKSASDCLTMLMSVPNRNMHTAVEVCDLRDLDSLVQMTVNLIIAIDDNQLNTNVNATA